MALPTLVKTWQFDVNSVRPAADTILATYQNLLWDIKESLKGFGTLPWTVVGSSNSVAAGLDGTDRWTAATNLVWHNAGSAHSWIVLKQTGLASNFQLLLDCDANGGGSGSATSLRILVSYSAGFTGGTTTARPTATDEHQLGLASWCTGTTTPFSSAVHVMQSTDGQGTRVFIARNNLVSTFWAFERLATPATGWSIPVVSFVRGATNTTTDAPTYAVFNDAANGYFRHGSTNYTGYITSEGSITSMLGEQFNVYPNDIDGFWPFFPMGFASTTVGARGRHGALVDMYWGVQDALVNGTSFPNDGTKQWVQLGHMVFPWNGTSPLVA